MATQVLLPTEFERLMDRAGPEFRRLLLKEVTQTGLSMVAQGTVNAKTRMNSPTGNLGRSIKSEVTGKGATLEQKLRAGGKLSGAADVVYAAIQERGGVVRPTRRKWLAIPTKSVKNPGGSQKYGSPRDYPKPLRFVFIFFGLAALVEDLPGGGSEVRWWLRKKTTIRPKWYLRDAQTKGIEGLQSRVADAFRQALVPQVSR